MTGKLLTAREIAEHLGLSSETVLAWVRAGKLPAFRLPSGQLRFREAEVEAWLAARSTVVQESGLSLVREESGHA